MEGEVICSIHYADDYDGAPNVKVVGHDTRSVLRRIYEDEDKIIKAMNHPGRKDIDGDEREVLRKSQIVSPYNNSGLSNELVATKADMDRVQRIMWLIVISNFLSAVTVFSLIVKEML